LAPSLRCRHLMRTPCSAKPLCFVSRSISAGYRPIKATVALIPFCTEAPVARAMSNTRSKMKGCGKPGRPSSSGFAPAKRQAKRCAPIACFMPNRLTRMSAPSWNAADAKTPITRKIAVAAVAIARAPHVSRPQHEARRKRSATPTRATAMVAGSIAVAAATARQAAHKPVMPRLEDNT